MINHHRTERRTRSAIIYAGKVLKHNFYCTGPITGHVNGAVIVTLMIFWSLINIRSYYFIHMNVFFITYLNNTIHHRQGLSAPEPFTPASTPKFWTKLWQGTSTQVLLCERLLNLTHPADPSFNFNKGSEHFTWYWHCVDLS